jgi:predicted component of type VI protein secretion system
MKRRGEIQGRMSTHSPVVVAVVGVAMYSSTATLEVGTLIENLNLQSLLAQSLAQVHEQQFGYKADRHRAYHWRLTLPYLMALTWPKTPVYPHPRHRSTREALSSNTGDTPKINYWNRVHR